MFWNVTFIYNAFIRTTDHCKVQTAFVSLLYIFINMKPWNASNSSVVVVGLLLIMQISKLFHWKATPTRAFNKFLYEFLRIFLISVGKFVKIRDFFCRGNEFSINDQHAPTPLDRHGDVCCSTVVQHLWWSVFHNGWTTPVELITFWDTTVWQSRRVQTVAEDIPVRRPQHFMT